MPPVVPRFGITLDPMNTDNHVGEETRANCDRFKEQNVARDYPAEYRSDSRRDMRERDAILRCLAHVPKGAHVLDFPCGTGRLLKLLQESGFRVSGADGSAPMIEQVQLHSDAGKYSAPINGLYERDVFESGFAREEFDAVICNRLFHHFNKESDRKLAFTELARISKGPVIVSFFNGFSISMTYRKLRKAIQGKSFNDRVSVSYRQLTSEIEACGLRVVYKTAARWGVSPLWYVVFERCS